MRIMCVANTGQPVVCQCTDGHGSPKKLQNFWGGILGVDARG